MTNYDIIQIVSNVLNTDLNGNSFTPAQYQNMINAASLRLFMRKLGLPQEYQRDVPIAQEGAGVSQRIDNDLLPFLSVSTLYTVSGIINLPADPITPSVLDGGIRCGVVSLSGSLTYTVTFSSPMASTNYDIANGLKVIDANGFDIGYESVTKTVNGFSVTLSTVNPVTLNYQAVRYV